MLIHKVFDSSSNEFQAGRLFYSFIKMILQSSYLIGREAHELGKLEIIFKK